MDIEGESVEITTTMRGPSTSSSRGVPDTDAAGTAVIPAVTPDAAGTAVVPAVTPQSP
jgi:hypothetical protein